MKDISHQAKRNKARDNAIHDSIEAKVWCYIYLNPNRYAKRQATLGTYHTESESNSSSRFRRLKRWLKRRLRSRSNRRSLR